MHLFKIFTSEVFSITLKLIAIATLAWHPTNSWSAACCSKNSAVPTLIVGDDEAQLGIGVSLGHVVAETFSDGAPIFKSPGSTEVSQSYRLDGAFLISERAQLGIGLAITRQVVREKELSDSSTGLGDSRLSLGYNILPVTSYSSWLPQGMLFSQITFPTGRSKYESLLPARTDITGNGFYSFTVGGLFIKNFSTWDFYFLTEVHHSLSRDFGKGSDVMNVRPGIGASIGLGAGWSPNAGSVRIGFRLQPHLDQGAEVTHHALLSRSHLISSCDTGLDLSYMLGSTDSVTMSYTDQTLLGVALNSNLTRALSLQYQHRWQR
jgi:hypothetical protein